MDSGAAQASAGSSEPATAVREGSGRERRLLAIFSTGRSGSTWLGSIVDSHPDVAYRFEPFARMRERSPRLAAVRDRLRAGDSGDAVLDDLYDALLPAHPLLSKPPFFAKSYSMRLPVGRSLLWPVCRRWEGTAGAFSALYSPRGATPPIAFKEVSTTPVVRALGRASRLAVVNLIRHPCGVVWSQHRGQRRGIMSAERHHYLESKLHEHDEALAERFAPRLAQLPLEAQYALLWRIDVEGFLGAAGDRPNVQVVFYERLCEAPEREAERIFRHFGLAMHDHTLEFLRESTGGHSGMRHRRGEVGIDRYFSVFRNTSSTVWSWRNEMPAEMRAAVEEAVGDSPAFQMGQEVADW